MTTFTGPAIADAEGVGALTLGGFLRDVVGRYGPNEAIVLDDALLGGATARWTYADLGANAERLARGLVAAGVAPGEAVGVLMGNRPEAVAALLAAGLIGAVAVPMSTFATVAELGPMLDRSGVVAVLTQARLLARRPGAEVAALAAERPAVRTVAVLGEPSWDDLLALGDTVDPADVEARAATVGPDDPGLVIFTSGTTSEPKAILHAHRSPALQCWLQAGIFGRHEATRMFSALPLFWTAGLNTAVGATLAAGGCWVAQETFEPGAALALLERERVTEPYTLPHQTAALAEHPDWATTDLSSVTCAYGKGAYARHPTVTPDPGWIMPVGYGLSEMCAFVAAHDCRSTRQQAAVGSGRLLPGVVLRVLDVDDGRPLGPGEVGELAVTGPTRLLRYLGDDPELAARLDGDGFLRTGDTGHVDETGVLHYAGRRTEMIKTGGANVAPAELEVQLRACPGVKLSRVLGVPDERLGEAVVACVVPVEGEAPTAAEVRAFLAERVAVYKVPRHVLVLDEHDVPMTGGDTKVRDDALRALVTDRLAAATSTDVTAAVSTTTAPAGSPVTAAVAAGQPTDRTIPGGP